MYRYAITITPISSEAIKTYDACKLEQLLKSIEKLGYGSISWTGVGYELKPTNKALHAHFTLHCHKKPWFPKLYKLDKNVQIHIGNDGQPLSDDGFDRWNAYCSKHMDRLDWQLFHYYHSHMFIKEPVDDGEPPHPCSGVEHLKRALTV